MLCWYGLTLRDDFNQMVETSFIMIRSNKVNECGLNLYELFVQLVNFNSKTEAL